MQKIVLEAQNIRLDRGDRTILNIDELRLCDGERVGLVGENGAGKTTLLKILFGDLQPDEGSVHAYAGLSRIEQTGAAEDAMDAEQAARFHAVESREGLSGGEQTRRRIAAAISQKASVLLADEPTTDLDAEGIALLREALQKYHGAIILVSHDRQLLDQVCTRIWHLEDGHIQDFPGNYTSYREELERRRVHQQFEYEQYTGEQARLRASMQAIAERTSQMRKAPKRMGNSEARLHRMDSRQISGKLHGASRQLESRLRHLEEKERPREDVAITMRLGAAHPVQAKTAMELRGLTLSVGGKTLLKGASMQLPTGSRTALTGANGCGKTTLLRAIAGQADLMDGQQHREIRLNPQVKIGWFDQDHAATLDQDLTAVENVRRDSSCTESDARTVLARLALRRDDALKPVRVLSGGEKARVALAKLLLADVNFLMLDEPTNHLDIFTREALEEMLTGYAGTVLFVTHDRAFLEAVATRVAHIEDQRLRVREMVIEAPKTSAKDEQMQMEITAMEMRLAALAARMSAPKKGDSPEKLNREYMEAAEALRRMRETAMHP